MTTVKSQFDGAPAPPTGTALPPLQGARDAVPGWLLPALLLLVATVALVALRPGHSWHDDFALYVLHARNLVDGLPYGATGYIYNPADPMHSPQVYPPGFPLLLAPVYAVFGLNFFALRLVVVASFVGAVAVFAQVSRPMLPPRSHAAAVALIGLQPFLLRFTNQLLPDFTFVLLALSAILLLRRLDEDNAARQSIPLGLAAGACMAAAISMRMVGVALFAGLALYHVLRFRLPGRGVIVAVVVALALLGIQALAMPPSAGYAAQIANLEAAEGWVPRRRLLLGVVVQFFSAMRVMWAPRGELWASQLAGADKVFAHYATIVTLGLATIGFVSRLRRVTMLETFVLAYSAVVIYWGFVSARYIVPLVPPLVLYGVIGVRMLHERGGRVGRAAAISIAVIACAAYTVNLARMPTGPYGQDVTDPEASELFAWLRDCTSADVRLAAQRPRALALFTGREAMTFGGTTDVEPSAFATAVAGRGVDYMVTFRGSARDSLAARTGVPTEWENQDFVVRRIPTAPIPICP